MQPQKPVNSLLARSSSLADPPVSTMTAKARKVSSEEIFHRRCFTRKSLLKQEFSCLSNDSLTIQSHSKRREERPRNSPQRSRYGTRWNSEKVYDEGNLADIPPCCSREPYNEQPSEELVDTKPFDEMKQKHRYISDFERRTWTEQQERTFVYRLMKYGRDFNKIAWEEKDISACVRYFHFSKYNKWFQKIVDDVEAAQALLLLSQPVPERHPIKNQYPTKPITRPTSERMDMEDVAILLLRLRDSLELPKESPYVITVATPEEPETGWVKIPKPPRSNIGRRKPRRLAAQEGAKTDQVANGPNSATGQNLAEHVSGEGGDYQATDSHISQPNQGCDKDVNQQQADKEEAVAATSMSQQQDATRQALAALGMSEQGAVGVLATAAQVLLYLASEQERITKQQPATEQTMASLEMSPQQAASAVSTAAQLLLHLASKSEGVGLQQAAKEQSMAARKLLYVSYRMPLNPTHEAEVLSQRQAVTQQVIQSAVSEQAIGAQTPSNPTFDAKGLSQKQTVTQKGMVAQEISKHLTVSEITAAAQMPSNSVYEAECIRQQQVVSGQAITCQYMSQQQAVTEQTMAAGIKSHPSCKAEDVSKQLAVSGQATVFQMSQQQAANQQATAVQIRHGTSPQQAVLTQRADTGRKRPRGMTAGEAEQEGSKNQPPAKRPRFGQSVRPAQEPEPVDFLRQN